MTRALIALAAFLLPAAAAAGPISKWDDREPDHRYVSSANIHEVQRCIIDADGWPVPHVFAQADRPDAVMLIYAEAGGAAGRIDLQAKADGLHVTVWSGPKAIRTCAPPI